MGAAAAMTVSLGFVCSLGNDVVESLECSHWLLSSMAGAIGCCVTVDMELSWREVAVGGR